MDAVVWKRMLDRVAELFIENREYLCRLDGETGDGDHGIAIEQIGRCIKERVHKEREHDSIKNINDDLSMDLMDVNGGSAGPLYGTIFEGMAQGVEENEELSKDEIREMFISAKEEFQSISSADIGDKTMVDALYPAVSTIEKSRGTLEEIFKEAAKAALEGSEKTKDMIAKFGRAKNIGERSVGHIDPGAASMALFFRGMAEGISDL